ncbi:MAG: hypothetical protein PHE36_07410 [Novosphingobium sp.]|nr:hypothetical protein [Novosphingobium sp.]
MTFKPAFSGAAFFAIALPLALGACAGDPGQYPSLAIRDIERQHGSTQPVEPAAPPPPVTPSADLSERLAQLQGEAASAHQAFMSAVPRVDQLVATAQHSAIASDPWVAAQSGLAGLESSRNRSMVVMADLDRMLVAVEMDGGAREAIAQAQASVDAMVREENSLLEGLIGRLRGPDSESPSA